MLPELSHGTNSAAESSTIVKATDRQNGNAAPGGRTAALDRQIDENLLRVYGGAGGDALPERFRVLLDRIGSGDARRDEAGPTGSG